MSQSRVAALNGLETLIRTVVKNAGAKFVRDPEENPEPTESGVVVMRDGDPGEPETYLSPPCYCFEHKVQFEILAAGPRRADAVENLIPLFDAALAGDRTMGGLVDDARVIDPPDSEDNDPMKGVAPTRSAILSVTLFYCTASGAG